MVLDELNSEGAFPNATSYKKQWFVIKYYNCGEGAFIFSNTVASMQWWCWGGALIGMVPWPGYLEIAIKCRPQEIKVLKSWLSSAAFFQP